MQIRVKIDVRIVNGAPEYFVNLPAYSMVNGSFDPVVIGLIHADGIDPKADPAAIMALNPTVLCEVPASDLHPLTGKPSATIIGLRYREHAVFGDAKTYVPPVDLDPAEIAAEVDLAKAIGKG